MLSVPQLTEAMLACTMCIIVLLLIECRAQAMCDFSYIVWSCSRIAHRWYQL